MALNVHAELDKIDKLKTIFISHVETEQARIQRIRNRAARTKDTKKYVWTGLEKEIKDQYSVLKDLFLSFSAKVIPIAYCASVYDQVDRLKRITTIFGKSKRKIKIQAAAQIQAMTQDNIDLMSKWHLASIDVLVQDIYKSIITGLNGGQEELLTLLRNTQQQLITDELIKEQIISGLKEKGTWQAAKNKILDSLLDQLQGDALVEAGSKSFTAKYYAELVARTMIREAQTEGVKNTAINVGADLVQVDAHNTNCHVCAPHEGKIYSISGNDPDFPALNEEGEGGTPFHPNCLHSISIIFREVMEQRGNIQDYIDFSNGDLDTHPTRESFVPLSERNIKWPKGKEKE